MFELLHVCDMYVIRHTALSQQTSSCITGTATGLDDGVPQMVPIRKCLAPPRVTLLLDLAKHDLTEYLMKILPERGHVLRARVGREIVRETRERFVYIALDSDSEMKTATEYLGKRTTHELMDGNIIAVGGECLRYPELPFNLGLIVKKISDIHETTSYFTVKCDVNIHKVFHEDTAAPDGPTPSTGTRAHEEGAHSACARRDVAQDRDG
jgi:hypothetical protein